MFVTLRAVSGIPLTNNIMVGGDDFVIGFSQQPTGDRYLTMGDTPTSIATSQPLTGYTFGEILGDAPTGFTQELNAVSFSTVGPDGATAGKSQEHSMYFFATLNGTNAQGIS